jgi:hypothetical protein
MRPNSGFFRGLIFFGNRNQASDLIVICTNLLRIFRKIQLNKQRFLTSVVFKKNEKKHDRGGGVDKNRAFFYVFDISFREN